MTAGPDVTLGEDGIDGKGGGMAHGVRGPSYFPRDGYARSEPWAQAHGRSVVYPTKSVTVLAPGALKTALAVTVTHPSSTGGRSKKKPRRHQMSAGRYSRIDARYLEFQALVRWPAFARISQLRSDVRGR